MHYTSGPGLDSQWRPNIFNSVLFKKIYIKACERERIHLMRFYTFINSCLLSELKINCQHSFFDISFS